MLTASTRTLVSRARVVSLQTVQKQSKQNFGDGVAFLASGPTFQKKQGT